MLTVVFLVMFQFANLVDGIIFFSNHTIVKFRIPIHTFSREYEAIVMLEYLVDACVRDRDDLWLLLGV